MTDQLTPFSSDQERTEGQLPPPEAMNRRDKIKSEVMAGGAVVENGDDELAGGWRGALSMALIGALFVWLAVVNIWWFTFVVGVVIAIFLHELGHFVTARWTGMKATQFFLFFGPRLWSFRRGETEYGVRALPLGAFVRIVGMNRMDDVEPDDEDRTYRQKSFPRRMLVISAGSIMHMIIAVLLLFVVYLGQGERTDQFAPEVFVAQATPSLPAFEAGIEDGDQVLSVGGIAVTSAGELGEAVRSFQPGEFVDVVVVRDGIEQTIPVGLGSNTDESSPFFGEALLGVRSGSPVIYQDHSVGAAAVNAVTDIVPASWESIQGVVKVLNPVNIVTHLSGTNDDLSSRPTTLVGVTALTDDVGDAEGIWGVLWVLAVLNVFVGVFNMFPLLPLDGGHAAVAIYERVREARRPGTQRYFADVERLMPFAMGVMVLLLSLMTVGLYLDIARPI
ncbi:MAG: site-2 protease family protein [Actinomycetota bacterium]